MQRFLRDRLENVGIMETRSPRFFRRRIGRDRFVNLRATPRAMPALLRGNEKLEIHKAETQAFRNRVGCSSRVARSNWLIAPFEAAFAAGFGGTAREQRTPLGRRRERPANRGRGIDCYLREPSGRAGRIKLVRQHRLNRIVETVSRKRVRGRHRKQRF
jgi:hypothetical protein